MKTHIEKSVIAIIEDAIVFHRILTGLDNIMNAFNPIANEEIVNLSYNGLDTVLTLLEISEDKLIDALFNAFYSIVLEDEKTAANKLSKDIYIEFLKILNDHYKKAG